MSSEYGFVASDAEYLLIFNRIKRVKEQERRRAELETLSWLDGSSENRQETDRDLRSLPDSLSRERETER